MNAARAMQDAMFDALRSHPRGTMQVVGPVDSIAWSIGRPSRDARLAETRPEHPFHPPVWYDRGLSDYLDVQDERAGEGVRLIIAHGCECSIVDHILPECPAVRRNISSASYAIGLHDVDADSSDICGWCLRVWTARKSKVAA